MFSKQKLPHALYAECVFHKYQHAKLVAGDTIAVDGVLEMRRNGRNEMERTNERKKQQKTKRNGRM